MSTRAQEHKSTPANYMQGQASHRSTSITLLCCFAVMFLFGRAGCKKTGQDSGNPDTGIFEIDRIYQKGPLAVGVRVDKSKITLADTLWLELETAIGSGYDVNVPDIENELNDFGVLDRQNLGNRLDANDNVVSTYRYRLEPFLSGKFAIPAFTFEFRDVTEQAGKTYQLTTEPIDIEVTSLLGEQRGRLMIADIEDVVNMPAGPSLWWILPAVVLVVGAGGVWLYRRRKKARAAVRIFEPAHEVAYARLQALINRNFIKQGKVREFYAGISDIIRHYIEDRFVLRAPERTTEEFLAEIRDAGALTEAHRKALSEFLTHCDLVKFAKYNPAAEQIQRTFDLAKNFIEQTKSDERKIDVTDGIGTPVLTGVK